MSIQFGVCAVLLHCDVSEEIFKKYDDKEVSALASGCVVEQLAEFDKSFSEGRQPAKIEVKLSDGTVVREELPDVPWLDPDAVHDRFPKETKATLESESSKKKLVSLLNDLDGLKDCSEIFKLFGAASPMHS